MRLYRRLLLAATLLALAVIVLGAYVRLSDAGLGCPDWPGCYGHWLGVPEGAHERQAAATAYPQQPVDTDKAWKEMIHRYFAGTLGLLILALCLLAWRRDQRQRQSPALPTLLLLIVGLQGMLGMWTVTLQLKPVIVTLHLLGGMLILSLLVGLALRERRTTPPQRLGPGGRWLAAGALFAVISQIALGGWVSSNYAALACPDVPLCQGQWRPAMDFGEAFSLHRELGQTTTGGQLSFAALTAIHWAHRVGALVVAVLTGALAISLVQCGDQRRGFVLFGLLLAQIGLGIANVLLALPLGLALFHTLAATALLAAVLAINIGQRRAGETP